MTKTKKSLLVKYEYYDPIDDPELNLLPGMKSPIVGTLGQKLHYEGDIGRIIYTADGPSLRWRSAGKFTILQCREPVSE